MENDFESLLHTNRGTDGQTDKQAGIGKHRRHLRISLQMKRKSFYFDFTHAFEAFTVRWERGTGKCFVCEYLVSKEVKVYATKEFLTLLVDLHIKNKNKRNGL